MEYVTSVYKNIQSLKPFRKRLEILIVVDEKDSLKRYAHVIKAQLETKTHIDTVKLHSIYDPDSERFGIKCDKVVFLLSERSLAREKQIHEWVNGIPNINDNRERYLIVYLGDGRNAFTRDDSFGLDNEIQVNNKDNTFKWWPYILIFIFGKPSISISREYMFSEICDIKDEIKEYKTRTHDMLKSLGANETLELKSGGSVILFCERLNQAIEPELKNRLRQRKIGGCPVYVFAATGGTISLDIKWISTWQFTKQDQISVILHLLTKLQLINVDHEYFSIPKVPSSPKGPVTFQHVNKSTAYITWSASTDQVENTTYIRLQQRSHQNRKWQLVEESIPNGATSYEVKNLELNEKYQFRLIRKNVDGESNPLTSKWICLNPEIIDKKQLAIKIALIIVCTITAILDVVEMTVIVAIVLGIIAAPIVLAYYTGKIIIPKRLPEKISPEVLINGFLIIHVVIAVIWLATAHLIFFFKTTPPDSSELAFYILPPMYFLIWPCVIHHISMIKFDCTYGIFSIPVKLWKYAATIHFTTRINPDNTREDNEQIAENNIAEVV